MGGAVLVTLLIMLAVFNLGMQNYIEEKAQEAIRFMHGFAEDADDDEGVMYNAGLIVTGKKWNDDDDDDDEILYSRTLRSLMEYCSLHEIREIRRVTVEGRTYYVGPVEEKWGERKNRKITSRSPRVTIAYVDVTGELTLAAHISLIFMAAAGGLVVLSMVGGYLTGRRLERNDQAQRRFFENTSHELKTPLAVIRGYAEGIQTGVIQDYPRTGAVISAQTEKMSRMVEEILLMARLESGSVSMKKETVRMREFVQDCLMPLEGLVKRRGLEVALELEDGSVHADPDHLDHALTNLLSNAIQYALTRIRITYRDAVLTIRNDCEPLTEDEIRHLFDRFYSGKGGNTGIGLALARDLLNRQGFDISARSEENGLSMMVVFHTS